MTALTKAMTRSRALVSTAHATAVQLKRSGLLRDQMVPVGTSYPWQGSTRSRQQYALFRGWLFAAINALASEAAGQPVRMGQKIVKGGRRVPTTKTVSRFDKFRMTPTASSKSAAEEMEIIRDHPILRSVEQPNEVQYRWQFVYSFVANLNLTGWSYIVGGKKSEDGGMEFYSVPTTWVVPDHTEGPFSHIRIVNPKKPESVEGAKPLGRENFAFAHLPNPSDPLSALAPAASQIMSIRIDDHIQTSQERFFENGIFPSVIVTIGKEPHPDVPAGIRPRLSGAQRRQVTGAIRKVMGGVANYGNPAIIDGLIENIERLSATSNEMGWMNSEKTVKTRILSAFCVHPYILGEAINVGGYAQAAKIEERFCKRVNTFLDMLGTVMSNFVGNIDQTDRMMLWWEKCEPHDPGLWWTNMRYARGNEDISQNELRAALGLPPDEDRNEAVLPRSAIQPITIMLEKVGGGAISKDQALAVLEGIGLPSKLAKRIAKPPEKPPEAPPQPTEQQQLGQAVEALEGAVKALTAPPVQIAQSVLERMKHLPGKHNQASHGRGGGGGDPRNAFDGEPANPKGHDTKSRYQNRDGSWTPERQALHDKIIDSFFEGKTPVDEPVSYLMGGGTASGKSSTLATGKVNIPENTVAVDSDEIKKMLPEFAASLDNFEKTGKADPRMAAYVHDESSYLSKKILARAVEGGYNSNLDGTGNTSVDKLGKKIAVMKKYGRKVKATYVTLDTNEAIRRSNLRGQKSGRVVPESILRRTHSSVSRVLPQAIKAGMFDEVTLWDNNVPKGSPPRHVLTAKGKNLVVHDQKLYDDFLAKGKEK